MASLERPAPAEFDPRLYLAAPEGWQAHIKQGWEQQYCYYKLPGQDHFHLIVSGEIYLQHGDEKVCLNCAVRTGVVTTDRLHWQHIPRKPQRRLV